MHHARRRSSGGARLALALLAVLVGQALGAGGVRAQNRLIPDFFEPIAERTGNSAIVLIGRDTIPWLYDNENGYLIQLDSLDEIGIFRRFPEGDSCVGAGVWQNKPLSITIWGDNEQTTEIDGLRSGDSLYFQVWRRFKDSLHTDVQVKLSANPPATIASRIYVGNGIYLLEDIVPSNEPGGGGGPGGPGGPGEPGEPDDGPEPVYFDPAYENTGNLATVILPVDANPRYSDGTPLDSLDEIGVFQWYNGAFRCVGAGVWQDENLALTIWGDDDITSAVVEGFRPGDSLYFRAWDQSADIEYDSVAVAYRSGAPLWNTTGLYAGNAIYVLDSFVAYIGQGGGGGGAPPEPVHFEPEHEATGDSATVVIPLQAAPAFGITGATTTVPLDPYDEIGIFRRRDDGTLRCVGAGVWLRNTLTITVWGDDEATPGVIEGLLTGDSLYYRVWDRTAEVEYDSVAVTYAAASPDPSIPTPNTTGLYAADAYYVLSSLVAYTSSGGKGGGGQHPGGGAFQTRHRYEIYFYPNPGRSGEIRMALQIPEGNRANFVRLKIFNILGQQVATYLNGIVPEVYIVDDPLPVDLPPGVYFYYFEAGPFVRETGKFVIIR